MVCRRYVLEPAQLLQAEDGTKKADKEVFRAAGFAENKKGVSKKSPYTLGFTGQVKALFIRQFRMRLQDRFQLITSFTLSFVSRGKRWSLPTGLLTPCCRFLPLLSVLVYYNLQLTSQGAYTRGSVMFAALLTCALETFCEVCYPS